MLLPGCDIFELGNNKICNLQILFFCSASHSNRTDNFAICNQWQTSRHKSNASIASIHAH